MIVGIVGDLLQVAASVWPQGGGGGRTRPERGAPSAQAPGTADCTAPDPATSGNAYYYRYLDYQLVDLNNNKVPTTQHYTVYEQLSPYKDFAGCKDKNGQSTGMSPLPARQWR